jgi:hypothetical protein
MELLEIVMELVVVQVLMAVGVVKTAQVVAEGVLALVKLLDVVVLDVLDHVEEIVKILVLVVVIKLVVVNVQLVVKERVRENV